MWGPLVLAGDLGAAPRRRDDGDGDGVRAAAPEPVALVTDRPLDRMADADYWQAWRFRASGVARTISAQTPIDVEFSPFFSMHRRSYTAYWDLLTADDLKTRAAELAAERERHARARGRDRRAWRIQATVRARKNSISRV